ncbi:MAG: M20/M25/M40 family metallo-hydrolase [Bacteroidota bacterium]
MNESTHPPTHYPTPNKAIPESALLLSQYVQYASLSGHEIEAGEFITAICEKKGLHIQHFGKKEANYNMAASLYPLSSAKPNLVFINHIDVVEAKELASWKYPPFSGKIAEGCVWGRGAYDNKGSTVLNLMAISHFVERAKREDLPHNVTMLCLSDEERFGDGGAIYVADHFADQLYAAAVIGEGPVGVVGVIPTKPQQRMFGISNVHKRALWLKLKSTISTNSHGSVDPAKSANKIMINALCRLGQWKKHLYLSKANLGVIKVMGKYAGGTLGWLLRRPALIKPLLPFIIRREALIEAMFSDSISITQIHTNGQAHNVIPNSIEALLDCRLMPETDTTLFLNQLRKVIKSPSIEIEIVKETPKAAPTSVDHPVFGMLAKAIQEEYPYAGVFPMLIPITSDSNTFRAKGIPTFSSVPVEMSRDEVEALHGPNERMPIEALERGIKVHKRFISTFLESTAI